MNIAIIPARAGSKRIPRKNIRPFAGKPMIEWPITAALESGLFERVIVSTDSAEIADIAKHAGAEAPFVRPPELSNDHVGTIPVIRHAIDFLASAGSQPDAVCCIYATSVFLDADDLASAYETFRDRDMDFCISACEFEAPVHRAFSQKPGGGIEMLFPEHFATRSQDLPTVLHDAAQFYWGKPDAWKSCDNLFMDNAIPFVVPRWRVEDIDTPDDWLRAEALFSALKESAA